ncbi:uncharacterized protein LOC122618887 [Drosophila teissieri]|uniref:uncharacterized protein LOC122618887 n=1 Tax=Drosophila teissieri TaxID=7243 RepID=UPI001CBA4619|nr:uncharacterized protein LOC122618887 [Drosophila teissieri]
MLIIWLIFSWVVLCFAQTVYVPYNHCADYSRYELLDDGRTYLGIFTHPSGQNPFNKWSATFDIRGHREIFVSHLMPYRENISNGQRGQVFVYFVNIRTELPILTVLKLNKQTLCNGTGYESPSTKITTHYTMELSRSKHN